MIIHACIIYLYYCYYYYIITGTFQLQGFITVNAVIVAFNFNCDPKFVVGGSVYLIGEVGK